MCPPTGVDLVPEAYLSFLARRVPADLGEQLMADGQPDISMPHTRVTVGDLTRPLEVLAFPRRDLRNIVEITGYIVTDHEVTREAGHLNDPWKVIYIASLHLSCLVSLGGVGDLGSYASTLYNLVNECTTSDMEGRLQVCRFLAWLEPIASTKFAGDDAELSGLLLAEALILGSAFAEVSSAAADAMVRERFSEVWGESQEWLDVPEARAAWQVVYRRLSAMKDLLRGTCDPAGTVRSGSDRLRAASGVGQKEKKEKKKEKDRHDSAE